MMIDFKCASCDEYEPTNCKCSCHRLLATINEWVKQ